MAGPSPPAHRQDFSMSDIWTVFAIVGAVIALFVWDRLPVVAVCIGCALALWATGVLTLNQSLAGFGDPATVFVASLFVASAALEKTGITAWAGQILMLGAGTSRPRLIALIMLFVGVLSALISVNGAVAALLPVVVVMAVRLRRPPSRLLMPLVFGAHCGLAAGADRHAGQRARLRGFARGGARRLRLLRVRFRRGAAGDRLHPARDPSRRAPAAAAREQGAAAGPEHTRAHPRRAVPADRRRAPAPRAARNPRWSGPTAPGSTSRTTPACRW